MKRVFWLLFLSGRLFAAAEDDFLLRTVTSRNLYVLGQGKVSEGEAARRGFLRRSFLPSLTLEFGQEKFQTGPYRTYGNPYGMLEARMNLFRGGRDSLESAIRDASAKVAEHQRASALREQLNKARKTQWQIVYNDLLIEILEREKVQNSRIKAQAERRARSGVATRSDNLEFNIYESELNQELESLRHENKILMTGLLPLLGVDSAEDVVLADDIDHEHDDGLLARPFQAKSHPAVSGLESEHEAAQLQRKMAKRWWTPSLDVYGGYYMYTLRDRDYMAQDVRDDRVVGARVTFEMFDGLQAHNRATVAQYQAEAKRLQARHAEKSTAAQYVMLKEDLLHTHEVMHYIQDRIRKSSDYMRMTLDEYDRGIKNSLDALTAMQRHFRYEKQYLEKKKEYQLIKADILALRGE